MKKAKSSTSKSKSSKSSKTSSETLRDIFDICPKNAKEAFSLNVKTLFRVLGENGVTEFEVEYEGSGDSGNIGGVTIPLEIRQMKLDFFIGSSKWNGNSFAESVYAKESISVEAAVASIFEEILDNFGIDWYNDDGGFGVVCFDVVDKKAQVKHNTRITTIEYEELEKDFN